MADEHQSIVGCVREATSSSDREIADTSSSRYGYMQTTVEFIHSVYQMSDSDYSEHPFIFHESEEDGRVCDACLKFINNTHFYNCSKCPSMFLHDYCYRLPVFLSANPAHEPGHKFAFVLDKDAVELSMFERSPTCIHCRCRYVRAFYECWLCRRPYSLDASCAIMPDVVTHEAHGTAHFLHLSSESSSRISKDPDCACCLRPLGALAYECRTCGDFAIHTWCAMLPKTVAHKFDLHPLRLTTAACVADICEICDRGVEEKVWRYGCERCDQLFHVDCIPCLGMLYKIKSLVSEGVKHLNIPKRLIRGLTLQGHGHGEEDVLESD